MKIAPLPPLLRHTRRRTNEYLNVKNRFLKAWSIAKHVLSAFN